MEKISAHNVALIPCYNVENYCESVVDEALGFVSYVIAVDDGSTDSTGKKLDLLAEKNPDKLQVIHFPENRGKGHALLRGFKEAMEHLDFKVLITLDADTQHQPSNIPHLARLVEEGADLVVGSRTFDQMPPKSRHANRIISLFLRLVYPKAPKDTQSGMRAFSKGLVEELAIFLKGGRYELEFQTLLFALKHKYEIKTLPISTIYVGKNVTTHYSPLRDSFRILKVFFLFLMGRL